MRLERDGNLPLVADIVGSDDSILQLVHDVLEQCSVLANKGTPVLAIDNSDVVVVDDDRTFSS